MQIDNLNELPEEKRPSEYLIWDAYPEELENWLDKVMDNKVSSKANLIISDGDFG